MRIAELFLMEAEQTAKDDPRLSSNLTQNQEHRHLIRAAGPVEASVTFPGVVWATEVVPCMMSWVSLCNSDPNRTIIPCPATPAGMT